MGILQRFKNIIRAKVNTKSSKTKKVNEEDLIISIYMTLKKL